MPGDASPDPHVYDIEYERLRAQIVSTVPPGVRRGVGLALLLRDGVTTWLRAVSQAADQAPPVSVVTPAPTVNVIPPTQQADVARLLAGLVLSARVGHRSGAAPGASL